MTDGMQPPSSSVDDAVNADNANTSPANNQPVEASAPPTPPVDQAADEVTPPDPQMAGRVDRLAGEPAPDITPEEFARLQKLGSLRVDARGRIRADRNATDDPGISLRKRRAWYH